MRKWRPSFSILQLVVLSASVVCIGGSTQAFAQDRCIVADPTGTPLNVRAAPDGRVVQTLTNGASVTVLDRFSFRGRTWVYIRRYEDGAPIGWVYRDYLDCNVQQHPPGRQEAASSEPAPSQQQASSSESSGTGFFVAPTYVLTNNHVINDCGRNPIQVSYPDRRPERAFISGRDETNDLALLKTELPNLGIASFRFGPRVGEQVAAYGFPLSGLLSSSGNFTLGDVTSLAGLGDDTRVLQTSTPVQPGNSGGPLLDMSGSVVGVIEFQLNALMMIKATSAVPQNVNFAIQTPIVMNFLTVKGVSPTLTDKQRKMLDPADVADLAKTFTVQVACLSVEPPPEASPGRTAEPPSQTPPITAASSFLSSSLGHWATGDRSNCSIPSKSYSLSFDGENIVWRNGVGNTDVEKVVFNDEEEFRTITLNSTHISGRNEAPGTNWIYLRIGPDRIQVKPGGRSPFLLARCQ